MPVNHTMHTYIHTREHTHTHRHIHVYKSLFSEVSILAGNKIQHVHFRIVVGLSTFWFLLLRFGRLYT